MLKDVYAKLFSSSRYRFLSKAANYTVTEADNGVLLTVTAAATITLPAPATHLAGMWLKIINTADTNLTIASGTADTIVTFNDAAADSVAFSTASEKIGAAVEAICDGAKWYLLPLVWDTQTATVVTA